MTYLQWAFWILGSSLQLVVLNALVKGPISRFPMVFAYTLCLFITTVADVFIFTFVGVRGHFYAQYYWFAELLRQSGLFALVVSLVMDALPRSRRRDMLVRCLIGVAVLLWIGAFLYHRNPKLNLWMTRVVRDLSFTSAVTNLVLWFTLISNDRRDTTRLLVVGALGLQMTGEAIGQAIRQLNRAPGFFVTGNIIIVLTGFLCLYIWFRAFARQVRERSAIFVSASVAAD